ncbi:nucleotidyltransferase domain-containing protein [Patescibacteria group bacterium]|nr:nucleotidyltransferase domain-containing protein [Patescibacteria group bacterium]
MTNNDLFQRVKELKLPIGKYALFGSAPLGIRKLKDCHDIDIVVTEDLWNEYKSKNWEIKTMPHGSQYLLNNEIELWKDWKPGNWDIQELIDEAEMIDGIPFVKLEYVIEWKRKNGREKDLKDIETIEKLLRTQK